MKGTKFILSPEFQPFSLNNTIFGIKRTRRIMKGNIVFVGIPFDLGTTYRSGARFAPFKIREMSRLISGVDFFLKKNIFENKSIVDYGDIKISNDVEQDIKNIEFEIKKIMKYGKFIALGGDHLITLPILRVLNKKYGKINLLHLDAHLDSWDIVNSNKINHGTWLRRAMEENLLSNVFQLGIRGSIYSNKDIKFSEENGINIITMRDFKNMGINKTVEKLNNEELIGYEFMKLKGSLKRKDYELKFGFDKKKAERHLNKMVGLKLVERKGSGPGTYYEIIAT